MKEWFAPGGLVMGVFLALFAADRPREYCRRCGTRLRKRGRRISRPTIIGTREVAVLGAWHYCSVECCLRDEVEREKAFRGAR